MPVIFISRGTMSGVHLLVDYLHSQTGIRCISREDLEKDVNEYGDIAVRILEKLAKAPLAYDQFSELRWPYMVLMRKALLEEIRYDDVVYHGYSSHLLLPAFRHFVRVRIEAPLEMRVTMTMQRLSCDEEKAREYITNADDQRVKWARFMYAQDIRNTMLYDLILNLDRVNLKAACGILECIMSGEDFQVTPESQAEIERLYLATKIEESLVIDPCTAALEIRAEVRNDGIRLIGPYIEDPELTTIVKIVQTASDTGNVQYHPGYASRFDNNGYSEPGKQICIRITAPIFQLSRRENAMDEKTYNEQITSTLKAIHALLVQTVDIQQMDTEIDRSIHELEKKQTETASDLLEHATVTNTLAGHRTDMAKERTALVREQTRLSTKSTELSDIRTELSHERTDLAGQRTNLSVLRTDFSRSRTGLAEQRNKMAGSRTRFSEKRTELAGTRTVFSNIRTALAQGRTYLALIRTGLAFLTLSIAFFRMFGLSWWTIFDGGLSLMSLVMTGTGFVGYRRANHRVNTLQFIIPEEEEAAT